MKHHGKNGKKESLHLCDLIMAFFLNTYEIDRGVFKKSILSIFCFVVSMEFYNEYWYNNCRNDDESGGVVYEYLAYEVRS